MPNALDDYVVYRGTRITVMPDWFFKSIQAVKGEGVIPNFVYNHKTDEAYVTQSVYDRLIANLGEGIDV